MAQLKFLSVSVDKCHGDIHHFNAINIYFCTFGQEFFNEHNLFNKLRRVGWQVYLLDI